MVWMTSARSACTFLVGVENRDQRHLGQVEPLAQEVDPDQDVELAAAQVADDLDPLDRLDVRMDVADADADLLQVVGQVLRHLLGERRDEHALLDRDAAGIRRAVVHLMAPADDDLGIVSPVGRMSCSTTRPDGALDLTTARWWRTVDRLVHALAELVE